MRRTPHKAHCSGCQSVVEHTQRVRLKLMHTARACTALSHTYLNAYVHGKAGAQRLCGLHKQTTLAQNYMLSAHHPHMCHGLLQVLTQACHVCIGHTHRLLLSYVILHTQLIHKHLPCPYISTHLMRDMRVVIITCAQLHRCECCQHVCDGETYVDVWMVGC